MRMRRKALLIGINEYPKAPLRCAVNDALALKELLGKQEDGTSNFHIECLINESKRTVLKSKLIEHFNGHADVSLLYFSGHGYTDEFGTHLVTPDGEQFDAGISLNDLLILANESKTKNRIIILDCCYAGAVGNVPFGKGTSSWLGDGLTILASSTAYEPSKEVNGHGVFTNLLLEGLKGGAADTRGQITAGSLYAYIDAALGALEQRPLFKTNVQEFISLRKVHSNITNELLLKLPSYFKEATSEYKLDPSYEDTNDPEHPYRTNNLCKPYAIKENTLVFKDLQKLQSKGLVIPVDAAYMFFAAMEYKSCKLTPLGQHYWRLVKENKI